MIRTGRLTDMPLSTIVFLSYPTIGNEGMMARPKKSDNTAVNIGCEMENDDVSMRAYKY